MKNKNAICQYISCGTTETSIVVVYASKSLIELARAQLLFGLAVERKQACHVLSTHWALNFRGHNIGCGLSPVLNYAVCCK